MIITFQEFEKHESDRAKWLGQAIAQYMRSDEYKIAQEADLYERQQNTKINNYVRKVYDITGVASVDFTNPNNRIASNFFHRLITQRVSYSLGNGVSFAGKKLQSREDKTAYISDPTKDVLGNEFDDILYRVGINAEKHGVCYCFDADASDDGKYHMYSLITKEGFG